MAMAMAIASTATSHGNGGRRGAETLAAMGTASLSVSQRVARDEAIGELEERKGKLAAAAETWGDADAVQPTAERAYRLGILAQGGHRRCSRRYFNFNGNRLRNGTLGSTVMAQSATGDTL
jgi:hypothetical protein